MREHKLYRKFSKCEFLLDEVQFLGNVIFAQGISMDPTKVEAVLKCESLMLVTEVRSFMGLAGYTVGSWKGFPKL